MCPITVIRGPISGPINGPIGGPISGPINGPMNYPPFIEALTWLIKYIKNLKRRSF